MPINPFPINNEMVKDDKRATQSLQDWLSQLNQATDSCLERYSDHLVLNPDFHWSRTIGNNPTTSDGEFVEEWFVKANGMTFAITPTFYTSTVNSSYTGSDRFINVVISSVNTNEFIIYQKIDKALSKLQNRNITISSVIKNNSSSNFKVRYYIGFDMTGGGTDTYSASSGAITIRNGSNSVAANIQCPKISTDNQTNVITIALKLVDLTAPVNADIFFIKPEISSQPTMLLVDHTLEKLKIDSENNDIWMSE